MPTRNTPRSNQAYLQFKSGSFTGLLGRQRITLDNQRFVGNVGWRQNEQTYDAVTLKSSALANTQLHYSYITNVNRITGPDEGSQPANYHGATHALNGKVELGAFGAVTGFAYLLDLENVPALSSSTYGVHWAGNVQGLGRHEAELARLLRQPRRLRGQPERLLRRLLPARRRRNVRQVRPQGGLRGAGR